LPSWRPECRVADLVSSSTLRAGAFQTDFYRARTDAGLALLEHLDGIRDKLIMTHQVEMEFKKHRQEAILEGFNAMKGPAGIPRPGLFSDAKTAKALKRDLSNAEKRISTLKKRLRRAMESPAQYDPVYKVCQRCFHKDDKILNVSRKSFARYENTRPVTGCALDDVWLVSPHHRGGGGAPCSRREGLAGSEEYLSSKGRSRGCAGASEG
jgi:hypothetical protein